MIGNTSVHRCIHMQTTYSIHMYLSIYILIIHWHARHLFRYAQINTLHSRNSHTLNTTCTFTHRKHTRTHSQCHRGRTKKRVNEGMLCGIFVYCTCVHLSVCDGAEKYRHVYQAWKCDFRLQSNSSLVCNFKHAHKNTTPSKQQQQQRRQRQRQQHCYK